MNKSLQLTMLSILLFISFGLIAFSVFTYQDNISGNTFNTGNNSYGKEFFDTDCTNQNVTDCFIGQDFTGTVFESRLSIGEDSYTLVSNNDKASFQENEDITVTLYKSDNGLVVEENITNLIDESASKSVCVEGRYLYVNKYSQAIIDNAIYEEGNGYIELSRCEDQLELELHYFLLSDFDK